jgi:HSP20 family protein
MRSPVARASFGSYVHWDQSSAEAAKRMFKQFIASNSGASGVSFGPGMGFTITPEMMKAFQKLLNEWQVEQQRGTSSAKSGAATTFQREGLAIDLVEDDLKYIIYADVPGLSKADLSIRLSKANVLTISGERKSASEERVLAQERQSGAFKREWPLPDNADPTAISAKVTDGVLTITVGKKLPEPEVDESARIRWV